jgi:hypothetical protein
MNRFTISFIILVVVLFAGILILIYPSSIVSRLSSNEITRLGQPFVDTGVLREIIILGSVLTISGLVGLSILGFRIFKDSEKTEIHR